METFSGVNCAIDAETKFLIPRICFKERFIPERTLRTIEAVGADCFCAKTVSLGIAMCTLALAIGPKLSIVRASSPSNALIYLIFCSKSVAPNSVLSKISKPTLLFLGIPRAAIAIRSL